MEENPWNRHGQTETHEPDAPAWHSVETGDQLDENRGGDNDRHESIEPVRRWPNQIHG